MPNSFPRIPSYRHHKPSGHAVVTLGGRDIYLGKYNSAAIRDVGSEPPIFSEFRGN